MTGLQQETIAFISLDVRLVSISHKLLYVAASLLDCGFPL